MPIYTQESVKENYSDFSLAEYNLFDYMPSWVQPLVGSPEERAAKLKDPAIREAMKQDVLDYPFLRTDWSRVAILETVHERNRKHEGRSIEKICRETNQHPVDVFLELALDEDLQTVFSHPIDPAPPEACITAPHSHVSVSDGGAHTRFLTQSTWPVDYLTEWVRDKEVVSLEDAHYKLSALPARIADFHNRGTLRIGDWADIIVYDQEELGFLHERWVIAHDFPGDERRVIQKATGLRYTIVNGTVTFEGNECSGALPGTLLRSCDSRH